ncbi:alpha-1,3-mannosyl-glycoprotein 2-beta-N-acetylglucosaminyltransferase [Sitophilus oryzae]|uniref:Alpha-1,3-mannosyl-glycoprotein 2-beta-N-acetylglucosaminyltransferase n=1 Tax=Sitophilus oryzae TaxID=7048 RepID=A0A6J2Y1Z2_SITOR|nr:alpha-1,3-mannosyl-glycoprotein 2-beta-N-acetylglucosaminyltransferase [Sitophilus oryzae]
MRLKRPKLIVGIILLVWSTVIFIFFSNNFGEQYKSFNNHLNRLEDGIQQQFKLNNVIISEARTFLEFKKEGHKDDRNSNHQQKQVQFRDVKIPILVIACNRITVTRCLDELLKYRPDPDKFPIFVSQDCNHDETTSIIQSYGPSLTLIQQPDQSDIPVLPKEKKYKGYFKIARHYKWALNQMFFNYNYSTSIIVEDDLEISPDFYEYFLGTYPLLVKDPTLWCVSAWNDNGKQDLINSDKPELLYRTDFFPGLGWMLTRDLWSELESKWPKAYWDDWMRSPAQRQDRSCIRPEISRTKTFGKLGVSNGMYFDRHLKFIKLNEKFVPFTEMNLTYLLKDTYEKEFVALVYKLPVISYDDLRNNNVSYNGSVRITYRKVNEYKSAAKKLGLMDDFRGGVPRMAYKGIVTFFYKGRTVHLAPPANWQGYDLTWS